ncbi:MAG: HEAT repeat domain-containing protein [Anaerolineae bacterium]|nr:HEAT repeat domain-containing protein [Anaerolineae bacterium]
MANKIKPWWDRQVTDWRRAEAADNARRLEGSTFSKDIETKMRQSVLRFATPKVLQSALDRDRYSWRPAADDLMQKDEAKAAQAAENLAAALDTFRKIDERDTVIGILVSFGPHAVEPLLKRLNGYEEWGRSNAISVLGKIGDVRALNSLTGFLFDADESLRVEAAQALQLFKVFPDTAALLKAAQDTSGTVRAEVAKLLEKAGDPKSIQVLIRMLQDEDQQVRYVAARALRNLNWTPENDYQKLQLLIAAGDWREVVQFGEMAVEPLLSLSNSDPYEEADVMAALLEVANPPLLERLIEDYGEWNKPRELILSAIEKMKYARTIPFILHVLEDLQRSIDRDVERNREYSLTTEDGEGDAELAASVRRDQALLEKAVKALKATADIASIPALVRVGKASEGTGKGYVMDTRRAIIEILYHFLKTEGAALSNEDLHLILEIPDPVLQELAREQLAQRG